MRRVVVTMNVTLDGAMQAPGRADEDVRGGFAHGGWALPYDDAIKAEAMGRGMAQTGAMLFGRRTYEDFYRIWPHRTDNPFTGFLNSVQKYVASRTLTEPLPWQNSTLLQADAADAVAALKKHSPTASNARESSPSVPHPICLILVPLLPPPAITAPRLALLLGHPRPLDRRRRIPPTYRDRLCLCFCRVHLSNPFL
jgi:dihydrofolate reductase